MTKGERQTDEAMGGMSKLKAIVNRRFDWMYEASSNALNGLGMTFYWVWGQRGIPGGEWNHSVKV